MVKIENIEELRKIKKSNYGYVIVFSENQQIIHASNCNLILENGFLKKNSDLTNYQWFSTYSLAEKELGEVIPCKLCNP